MRTTFLAALIVLVSLSTVSSQAEKPTIGRKSLTKGNTYALIIGISDYKDPKFEDLSYAARDAEKFAEYLTSAEGGSVSNSNIKLLTNQNATNSNIYAGIEWLENKVKKDDLVYFYFSGHGDVIRKLRDQGFLIAHETKKGNYLTMAVRLADLNNMANLLSVEREAQVVFITDACRSGSLTGSDNMGRFLVGAQLSKAFKNEIRMTSCAPDQESLESRSWGGGRGAFSYHLINGLKGDADAGDKDGKITVSEIRTYLETNVPRDVFALRSKKQIPIIEGPAMRNVALVHKSAKDLVVEKMDPSVDDGKAKSAAAVQSETLKGSSYEQATTDLYFQELRATELKEDFDFAAISEQGADRFAERVLETYTIEGKREWKQLYKTNKQEFKTQLAATIHDEALEAIYKYCAGDLIKLERQQILGEDKKQFEEYKYMMDVALSLIDSANYLYHIIEVKKYYFGGLAARLSTIESEDDSKLIQMAIAEQQKALALEEDAAYIHNELGILYNILGDQLQAHLHYIKAAEIAPDWALPKNNLSYLYHSSKLYQDGLELGSEALSLEPKFLNAYLNYGYNAEKLSNLLLAEECFRRAQRIENHCFEAYEGLGYVHLHKTDYGTANEHYQTSDDIKKGFKQFTDLDFSASIDMMENGAGTYLREDFEYCVLDTTRFGTDDFIANVVYGVQALTAQDTITGVRFLRKAISVYEAEPIAYHYLATVAWAKKDTLKAEHLFRLATAYHKIFENLELFAESSIESQQYTDCDLSDRYKHLSYDQTINTFILGGIYEDQKNIAEAEEMYKLAIKSDSEKIHGYYKLWNLYQARGLYKLAESMLLSFSHVDNSVKNELFAFYNTMDSLGIETDNNKYKAAMLLVDEYFGNRDYGYKGKSELVLYDYHLATESQPQYMTYYPYVERWDDIPGTNETVLRAATMPQEAEEVIRYLKGLREQYSDEVQSDIYFNIGLLHYENARYDQAMDQFEKCQAIDSTNNSVYRELIPLYFDDLRYVDGYNLLYKLYSNGAANYNEITQLGTQSVLAGNYLRSDTILTIAAEVDLFWNEQIATSQALRHLLSGQWTEALTSYSNLAALNYSDDIDYTLSRIYCQLGDKEKALTHLQKANDDGFDYHWVLLNDPLIEPLRDTDLYKTMSIKEQN